MPGEFSTVGAQLALNRIIGKDPVRNTYIALLSSAPTDAGTIATLPEINTSGYARQLVNWTSATATSPSVATNSSLITFGPFTAAMAFPATHCALVSAGTGTAGDFLFHWTLEFVIQAGLNESVQFALGALQIELT